MDLTNTVDYVRFETSDYDHIIYGNVDLSVRSAPSVSIGAVTGRIQTLINRNGLRFSLYDRLFDKAIACYLSQGQEEMMREDWGKRARVSGRVSREATTGRPIAVRRITSVKILEEPDRSAYRKARGVISWKPGDKLPEQAIREMRDAE